MSPKSHPSARAAEDSQDQPARVPACDGASAAAAPSSEAGVTLPSYRMLGFKITPTTVHQLIEIIACSVVRNEKRVIASQNLHGIYTYFKDEKFRSLHELACVHIDGMPIIWMGRLLGLPLRAEQRTAWIDWFMLIMDNAARKGWRIYYLGAEPEVLAKGLDRVRQAYPAIQIEGRHGYFDARSDSAENQAVVDGINAFQPHVLIVGMGMGRQEHWILDNLDRLNVNCIGTAGACIEYFAGAVSTPPRWLGKLGLEWAYRLCENPRRFGWRYLVEPWLTAWLILVHQLRERGGVKRWNP